jgi:hypothetical protein
MRRAGVHGCRRGHDAGTARQYPGRPSRMAGPTMAATTAMDIGLRTSGIAHSAVVWAAANWLL